MCEPITALAPLGAGSLAFDVDSPEFRASAVELAEAFHGAQARIVAAMSVVLDESERLRELFAIPGKTVYGFSPGFRYGHRDIQPQELGERMKRDAWELLVQKLGIRDIMGIAKRKEFDSQLESGELPEVTAETIMGVILGLADQARDFATEAVREVFDFLRPHRGDYKTNHKYHVGRRVILSWAVSSYGAHWGTNYHRDKYLAALDNVFHVLDGKGILREGRPPLIRALQSCPRSERGGETEYFRFKCFKNQNLHLEFKRLDLVRKLNQIATGDAVIGEGDDDRPV